MGQQAFGATEDGTNADTLSTAVVGAVRCPCATIECLWQIAALSADDDGLWRQAAEQYTRVVHLDPKGPHVREAAYAAVLAWQNELHDNDADLRPGSWR